MIRRIGEKRPKYFAVMDLTSGYHQAPLSLNSRKYTAFICFLGLFEWLRVPMGLKGAPSYFQRVLSTVVLTGLMYLICELYIDDILVFGRTEEEFIKNLREVFMRFRKHNLTLNPKKCKYGISQVEYVGHVIDENGVTFSKEKREKVLTFPLPTHMKQLKKFLGLANYFRDHVKNHSDKVRPLQRMIDNYDKRKRLDFTPDMEKLFYEIRDEISNCPTLFFLDPNGEIFVQTDASDYGIGAYIFQKVNGVERPAWFISKTLDSTQCNWSTPEKEAYAIYYTLMHAEHLLRDVHFVLQTDHRNLTFINMEGSPKIRRWKLAIQEYDFDIEYLPGEKNVVADNFSRLCDIENPDETLCTFSELRIPDREYRLISKVHNSNVGHHGVERTIDKLHKLGHTWTHLREHVRKFIRQCPCCQLMSHVKIPIKTHPFTRATYLPMECLNIDTIGPVPKDQFGNEYILVIIDCFTRFVELYPVPDTTALSAARAILSHAGRYGIAGKYLTDNGPQYANELLSELRKLLRTEHEFTIPYSKEENSIVERANKEVMRHLRAIIYDSRIKDSWSMDYLPLVMRILNSEEKERTGVTPAELLFGNTIQLDRRILCPPSLEISDNPPMSLSSHMEKLLNAQSELIKIAQEHQSKYDEYHMSKYESGFTEFPINSYVLLAQPDGERPSNKLKTNLKGPFRIVNINGAKYTIQNLLTSKNMDVHISRLKPFIFDIEHTDPKEVAMHEQEKFLIETIIAHRGDRTRRKTMEFKVRWVGYDSSHDSWEPYSNLRDTDQLLNYLKANNLKALINKKHKQ
jgi:transposase InsO family protein